MIEYEKTERSKTYKAIVVVSIIHFAISFYTDQFFFSYLPIEGIGSLARVVAFKGLFFLVLLLIWKYIFLFASLCISKKINKTWLSCSIMYFCLLIISTLCVWPGMWVWDEFYTINANINLHVHVWQSLMSNIIYIISLMLIPFPTGIVIIQIIIVSIIVGYVLQFLFSEFECGIFGRILLWIPFLIIPVFYFAQAPIRLGLYSFLELLLITELYKLYKYKQWNNREIILAVVLTSIVATWRTEAIYYVIVAPILICFFLRRSIPRRKRIVIIIAIISLTFVQYFIQNYGYHKTANDEYEITAYINPIQELVGYVATQDPNNQESKKLIAHIDRVLNTEIIIQDFKSGMTGIESFWSRENLIREYNTKDLKNMKKAYFGLIMHYPMVFFNERFKTYISSTVPLGSSLNLMNDNREIVVAFRNHLFTDPINLSLRNRGVRVLEIHDFQSLHDIVFNPIVTHLILIIMTLICVVKKKWGLAGILSLSILRIPLVFMTAPASYFMYYFPTYLLGVVLVPCILLGFNKYVHRNIPTSISH